MKFYYKYLILIFCIILPLKQLYSKNKRIKIDNIISITFPEKPQKVTKNDFMIYGYRNFGYTAFVYRSKRNNNESNTIPYYMGYYNSYTKSLPLKDKGKKYHGYYKVLNQNIVYFTKFYYYANYNKTFAEEILLLNKKHLYRIGFHYKARSILSEEKKLKSFKKAFF